MASRKSVRRTTDSARTSRRLPKPVVRAIRDGKILGIKAGSQPHRFIGIWAVVVDDRVFVRSWSI